MLRISGVVIVMHVLVNAAHAVAHVKLGLFPSPAEGVFIGLVIYLAPLVAALLLGRGRVRAGMGVFAASMFGSLAFATHHHFLVVSPDHVAHLPAGGWRLPFQVTASSVPERPVAVQGNGLRRSQLMRLLGPELLKRAEPIFHVEGFCNLAVFDGLNVEGHDPETLAGVRHTEQLTSGCARLLTAHDHIVAGDENLNNSKFHVWNRVGKIPDDFDRCLTPPAFPRQVA